MVNLAGSKRCKGKSIGGSSSLVVFSVEFHEAKAQSCAEFHH